MIERIVDYHGLSASPTVLARRFNILWSGRPITVYAARKWLCRESIPTQDKLRILAGWLQVTPEWLRFGGELNTTISAVIKDSDSPTGKLITSFARLRPRDQEIVQGLVDIMLKK